MYISVASRTTLVFGYFLLNSLGMFLSTNSFGGHNGSSLSFMYRKLNHVHVIRLTVDCETPNLYAISCSTRPNCSRTNVIKNSSSGSKILCRRRLLFVLLCKFDSSCFLEYFRLSTAGPRKL